MAASSSLVTEEVVPYQFESRRDDGENVSDDDGWITESEVKQKQKLKREDVNWILKCRVVLRLFYSLS